MALNRGHEDHGALRDRDVPFRRYTPIQADPHAPEYCTSVFGKPPQHCMLLRDLDTEPIL